MSIDSLHAFAFAFTSSFQQYLKWVYLVDKRNHQEQCKLACIIRKHLMKVLIDSDAS